MAYIFKADIHCQDCGNEARKRINEAALAAYNGEAHADDRDPSNPDLIAALGFDPADDRAYDSDDYPAPAGEDGGEADCPNHCGTCGEFLANPLTEDGMRYVIEAIAAAPDRGDDAILKLWYDEYLDGRELRDVRLLPYRDGLAYRLRTFDLYRSDRMGKRMIAYIFGVDGKPALFWGDDHHVAPGHSIDSDDCLRALLGFLTLRPGDTDREWFDPYTPEQLAFARSNDAETLQLWADEDSRMPMPDYALRVWVRIGDGDDYHAFDWVREAAQFVAGALCADPLTRDCRAASEWKCTRARTPDYRGVVIESGAVPSAAEFRADVSLFWGEVGTARYDCELDEDELADFAEELISCDVD